MLKNKRVTLVSLLIAAIGLFLAGCTSNDTNHIPPLSPCNPTGISNADMVCGEDGNTYLDSCWAAYEGNTTVAHKGPCGVEESEACIGYNAPSQFYKTNVTLGNMTYHSFCKNDTILVVYYCSNYTELEQVEIDCSDNQYVNICVDGYCG